MSKAPKLPVQLAWTEQEAKDLMAKAEVTRDKLIKEKNRLATEITKVSGEIVSWQLYLERNFNGS